MFEGALLNTVLQLDYLTESKRNFKGRESFDRAAFEAGFDAFMDRHRAMTIGTLVKRVQSLAEMDAPLKALIFRAVMRRNFLTHRFFWERSVDFAKSDGRDRMLEELKGDCALFEEADKSLVAFVKPYQARLGFTEQVMQRHMAQFYEEQGLTYGLRED